MRRRWRLDATLSAKQQGIRGDNTPRLSNSFQYFDITAISREGLNEPEIVASDGLHPLGDQYRLWMELMIGDVRKMLEQP